MDGALSECRTNNVIQLTIFLGIVDADTYFGKTLIRLSNLVLDISPLSSPSQVGSSITGSPSSSGGGSLKYALMLRFFEWDMLVSKSTINVRGTKNKIVMV